MEIENLKEKVKAIILNKVDGIKWNYYQVKLNDLHSNSNEPPNADWFNNLVLDNGYFKWNSLLPKPETQEILTQLVNAINIDPRILFDVMKEIYRGSEIENNSDSDEGILGKLNETDSKLRNQEFYRRMKDGFRTNARNNKVVLMEGDSWFLFPTIGLPKVARKDFVLDIGDHLIDKSDVAVYNLAYGGDWLSHILYESKYVDQLDLIEPDVFLISGGGNDMVGGKRIKQFVKSARFVPPEMQDKSSISELEKIRTLERISKEIDNDKYRLGLKWLNDKFIDFLNVLFIQYFSLFVRIYKNTNKFNKMVTITQGYDYAIPSRDNTTFFEFAHKAINKFVKNGNWLIVPLEEKGITKTEDQQAILYAMIFEFNEMLLLFHESSFFGNVYHCDNRNTAKSKNDWFDELHLESEKFKEVAERMYQLMNNGLSKIDNNPINS
jgi:hypothetical protein